MSSPPKTIPVKTGMFCTTCNKHEDDCTNFRHGYDNNELFAHTPVLVHLDYDAVVLPIDRGVSVDSFHGPQVEFQVRPYRVYHKPTYFGTKAPSHYEFYCPHDAVCEEDGDYVENTDFSVRKWDPYRWKKFHYKKGDPHPSAGKVRFRFPTCRLGTLAPGDKVYVQDSKGEWVYGEIQPFEDYRVVRKTAEKAVKKVRKYKRMLSLRKTLWDMLDD